MLNKIVGAVIVGLLGAAWVWLYGLAAEFPHGTPALLFMSLVLVGLTGKAHSRSKEG